MNGPHDPRSTHSAPPPTPESEVQGPVDDRPKGRFLTRYAGLPVIGIGPSTAALGVLVAAFVMITGTIVVAAFDPDLESTAAREAAQAVVAIALFGTAVGFALARHGARLRSALTALGMRGSPLGATIGLAILAWGIYLLSALVLTPLLQPEQEDIAVELGTDFGSAWSILTAGLLIVVAAPISEEVFFRGFMFGALRNSLPLWTAALISALVWGALHLSGGNLGVAIQLSLFGIVLAWLYERSGSLWSPILAHTINNAIAFTVLVSGSV